MSLIVRILYVLVKTQIPEPQYRATESEFLRVRSGSLTNLRDSYQENLGNSN